MKRIFCFIPWFMIGLFFILLTNPNEVANGFILDDCKQPSSIVTWEEDSGGLSTTNRAEFEITTFNYNQLPVDVFFTEVDSGGQIKIGEFNQPDGALGFYIATCTNGETYDQGNPVEINVAETSGESSRLRQMVWAHELGHALGLDHPNSIPSNRSIMHQGTSKYDDNHIFVPVLDDINGLQFIYGTPQSTPQCNFSNNNGNVDYIGTCGSEDAALPMTVEVITAGSGHRAFAYDTAGESLPSSGTALFTTKVTPNTLYRFSTGIHTNTDVFDDGSRYATIELDDDGIKAVNSELFPVTTISSDSPEVGTTYFLQLVVQEGVDAVAYAFEDDGSVVSEPTFLGSATFETSGTWTGTKYFGTGVWTDSSSNPKSDYDVEFYSNYFLCIPPITGDWNVDFSCTLPKNSTAPEDVIINSNSRLTIPEDITLDIKFDSNKLEIISGSSVMIRDGGKVD